MCNEESESAISVVWCRAVLRVRRVKLISMAWRYGVGDEKISRRTCLTRLSLTGGSVNLRRVSIVTTKNLPAKLMTSTWLLLNSLAYRSSMDIWIYSDSTISNQWFNAEKQFRQIWKEIAMVQIYETENSCNTRSWAL